MTIQSRLIKTGNSSKFKGYGLFLVLCSPITSIDIPPFYGGTLGGIFRFLQEDTPNANRYRNQERQAV
jgi:hypothetical protein